MTETIAGWQGLSADGLEPGDEGTIVHLVTLDGRCMAGIALEVMPGGRIVVKAMPTSGMPMPNPGFLWAHDPEPRVTRGTGYHRLAECPRRIVR